MTEIETFEITVSLRACDFNITFETSRMPNEDEFRELIRRKYPEEKPKSRLNDFLTLTHFALPVPADNDGKWVNREVEVAGTRIGNISVSRGKYWCLDPKPTCMGGISIRCGINSDELKQSLDRLGYR
jgi:hypothetical protein